MRLPTYENANDAQPVAAWHFGKKEYLSLYLITLISVHVQALLFARSSNSQDLKGLSRKIFLQYQSCVCVWGGACVPRVRMCATLECVDILNKHSLGIR